MSKPTDEKFFAWLDGELSEAEADEVAARVAADPELSARAAEHRALAERLRSAFDPIAAAPVPERIAVFLKPQQPGVVPLAWRAGPSERRFGGVPQWAAMAATLALGIFVGTLVSSSNDNAPLDARNGAIYAAGSLDAALERQLASAGAAGGGDVRVGLSFRDQSGTICRSFTGEASSGLACRDGDDWRLRGMFAAPEGQGGDYRMAAGQDPHLAELIDSTMAGEPFDAEQEAAARNRGWR
ncbi:MAG: anti-sigma factor [Pseudomonadota bacterium]|nr:anti-sigma factor [Pseudomonadota bacterium]